MNSSKLGNKISLAAMALLVAGCSSGPADKTPDQIRAETQADIAANNAKLETDPVAIKCRKYSGPAYDGERRKLAQHLMMNPRVAAATMDPAGEEYDPTLDVLLRRGVTASQTRALAFRIQGYMAAHYSGDRALIVRDHHPTPPGQRECRNRRPQPRDWRAARHGGGHRAERGWKTRTRRLTGRGTSRSTASR